MSLKLEDITVNEEYEKLVPPLPTWKYNQLKSSIRTNGLYLPIIINEKGIVLDGHHRHKICNELVIQGKYKVKKFESKLLEKKFVILVNLDRRQLNDFQLSELAIPLLEIEKELAKENMSKGGKGVPIDTPIGRATSKVSKQTGISTRTLERAKVVIEKGSDELKEKCRKGETSIAHAYTIVNVQERHNNPVPIPEDESDVILADPPWKYDSFLRGNPQSHYDLMDLEDICKLKVPSAKDCILFLWVPAPKIKDGLQVLEAWGFEYKTHMVWVKDQHGTGYYFRNKHELLFVGKKGNIPAPFESNRVDSVLYSKRREHSQKPDEVYEIIEKYYPNRRHLELFARNKRKGWESWGNEI